MYVIIRRFKPEYLRWFGPEISHRWVKDITLATMFQTEAEAEAVVKAGEFTNAVIIGRLA